MSNQQARMTDVLIPSGQTTSAAVMLGGGQNGIPARLLTPAAFTGTGLTFQGSVDGVTYYPLYDQFGGQVSLTIGTSEARSYELPFGPFVGVMFLKIVAGSAQAADRTLTVVMRAWD